MSFLPERLPVWVLVVALVAFLTPSQAADAGGRADYVGGTLANLPPKAGGRIRTADQQTFVFETERTRVQVPYESINLLEYGQQTGRRFIMAIVISPVFLLTKARKHFLTVAYKDEQGRQQAMVFRLNKSDVRAVLAGLEARTGLKVEFQDGEARKAGGG